MSQRQQRSLTHQQERHSLRAIVKVVVDQVRYSFLTSKLPVYNNSRVIYMILALATTINIRRIPRYLEIKIKLQVPTEQEYSRKQP